MPLFLREHCTLSVVRKVQAMRHRKLQQKNTENTKPWLLMATLDVQKTSVSNIQPVGQIWSLKGSNPACELI